MSIQDYIIFIIVGITVASILYRTFRKKKNGFSCDSCSADCQLRSLKKKDKNECKKKDKNERKVFQYFL